MKLLEEEDLLLTAAYLHAVADYEENKTKTQEEEEVCLDERLAAAQSAVRSV